MKFLFFAFLVVPIVEIYFLIAVGSVIGAGTTIFLIILTAVIGAALVRSQGMSTYARAQAQLRSGEMPAMELLEGMFLLVAGALLMTPGFVTDSIGFALLTPPIRQFLIKRMLSAGVISTQGGVVPPQGAQTGGSRIPHGESRQSSGGRVIEGEYRDIDN